MTRQRDELLDHDADGIREFDNDLPRWWLYGFYFTIAFSVVYLVNYHLLSEPWFDHGSIAQEYAADMAANPSPMAVLAAPVSTPDATGGDAGGGLVPMAPLTDAESLAGGQAIFESMTHPCHACHRADLGGLVGPNLTDDLWLHGCSVTDLVNSMRVGYPLQGMLPYGGGSPLSGQEMLEVASYILSKGGSAPANPKPPDESRAQPCG